MCPRPDARAGGGARPQVDQRESPGNAGDSGLWDSRRGAESKELGSAGRWPSRWLERALGGGRFDFPPHAGNNPGSVTGGLRRADPGCGAGQNPAGVWLRFGGGRLPGSSPPALPGLCPWGAYCPRLRYLCQSPSASRNPNTVSCRQRTHTAPLLLVGAAVQPYPNVPGVWEGQRTQGAGDEQ